MMPPTIIPQAALEIKQFIDVRRSNQPDSFPGVVFYAVDRHGELFSHASGTTGLTTTTLMSEETVFWLASCTKLITSIACMQLVEQGLLSLDDHEQLQVLSPELRDVKVLQENGDGTYVLVEKERPITLRMLMSHTAGFGYAFEDRKLANWARPVGTDDFDPNELLDRPLVNQPGTKFQYGTSIDWVGKLIERVSGQSLESYFSKNIFEPLGLSNIRFFPSITMRQHLARMHERSSDGTLRERDHIFRRPLLATTQEERDAILNSGGCGCFGRPSEFAQIIATILNEGLSPKTNNRILRADSVKAMFENQIPDIPRRADEYVPVEKPWLANPTPLFPVPEGLTEGWGLSFSLDLRDSDTGRRAGSGAWEGMPNLLWFADPTTGVGMVMAAQVLPYGDKFLFELNASVEKQLYSKIIARK